MNYNIIWKPIEQFNGSYCVSNTGLLKNSTTNKILKQTASKNGYLLCSIKPDGRKGKTYCLRIHREVALAFIPNPNNNPQVNHIDCNKQNNNIENLEWVTAKENSAHAAAHGLHGTYYKKGTENGEHKLTDEQILEIRKTYIPRHMLFGTRGLGKKYNISHQHISSILRNVYWTHLLNSDEYNSPPRI